MARSPKSCERSLRYGVSPHPPHAPENSKSGWSSCESFTEFRLSARRSISGRVRKKPQLTRSASRRGGWDAMLIALSRVSLLFFAGQASTHSAQPVQSSGDTCRVYRHSENSFQRAVVDLNFDDAPSKYFASYTFSRMTACGQTSTHLPHWMQMSGSHTGISSPMLRFSHCAVPVGYVPSTGIALTGSSSPNPAIIFAVTLCPH